ncbi:MAG: 3-hydroxyacyl-CoA dehydrogenase NAD-binding domain-containing protein, partial [Aurantibacter sp.]
MNRIAVIGAGTMGNGIAHVFAQNGYPINLVDISEES